jgi:hypothetical protein
MLWQGFGARFATTFLLAADLHNHGKATRDLKEFDNPPANLS